MQLWPKNARFVGCGYLPRYGWIRVDQVREDKLKGGQQARRAALLCQNVRFGLYLDCRRLQAKALEYRQLPDGVTLRIQKPRRPRALTKSGAPRAKPVDWEGQEQAVLIRWLYGEKMRGLPVSELFDATFHVPNGGHRNKKTASALKRQGVKAGVSDLPVRQARGGWFGLYLEFKATPPKDAPLADSQFEWL
ncbi:VRR-NUC domain-containing protein [Vreelandella boliviensis]|uniref:VRR-NUC domain-containing protein n=1 Tax=Vreelandella boliviensis TaxID=223527 RepID=UPI001FCB4FA4|nr:VRR-NUC domain-containing protein [Halomonas boliviensis]